MSTTCSARRRRGRSPRPERSSDARGGGAPCGRDTVDRRLRAGPRRVASGRGQRFGRTERMARAAADGRPAAEPSGPEDRAEVLRGIMADLRLAALPFIAQARVEETARHWLADGHLAEEDEDVAFALGEAL